MAGGLTQCAFYIPLAETTTAVISLVLANSAVGARTVSASLATDTTLYNDHNVTSATTNHLRALLTRLEGAETTAGTDGTYTLTLVSSDQGYGPVYKIERTQGSASDLVTSLTITSGAQAMTDAGFAADVATPDAGTASADPCVWTASHRAARSWTTGVAPQWENGCMLAHDFDDVDLALGTTSPTRVTYDERIARYKRKQVVIQSVYGAAVKRHYKDTASFMSEIGAATGDPEAALARWCQRLVDSGQYSVRFVPDVTSPGTAVALKVTAEDQWRYDLRRAIVGEDASPRALDLVLTFDEE